MLQAFRNKLKILRGREDGAILAACSGGSDSMALAELAAGAAEIDGFKLVVAHTDHGLREESGEREHLETWAKARGVRLISRAIALPESLEEEPGNLEARARELRYRALGRIAHGVGAKIILTGHTADDQAETLWLWLLRGTGLRGLRGIAPARPLYEDSDLRLIRPLLEFTRFDLREYLKSRELSWLEDPSNEDRAFRRNRIRHELLPYLRETFEMDPVPGAARLGTQARDLTDFLDGEILDRGLEPEHFGEFLRLNREALMTRPATLARWAIAGALMHKGVASDLSVARIIELNKAAATGKTLELGDEMAALFTSLHVYLGPQGLALPEAEEIPLHRFEPGGNILPDWGDMTIGAWTLRIRELGQNQQPPKSAAKAIFDLNALQRPLRLDNPKPGMRIRPMGAGGGKSLSDLLIDRKVPRHWRQNLIVLLDSKDTLLWVLGLARGEGAPVGPETKFCLTLDLDRASS